jgi:radical SAM protein with 4Fe4S-binding SPASM domain
MKYMKYGSGTDRAILHPLRSSWMVMNATARAISSRLLRGVVPAEVATDLARECKIPYGVALEDVFRVQDKLKASHFLNPEDTAVPKRNPEPRSIFFHLTRQCNLSCPHCCAGSRASEIPMDLPTELVIDLVDQLKASGGRSITLSGGEALFHPDTLAIIEHARPELEIRLLTNGTQIDRNLAAFLFENRAEVQVSIDGSNATVHDAIRGSGTFEKALRALHLLQEAGLSDKLNTATTVMRQNLGDLPNIIDLAERLGIPLVRFLPLRKHGTAVHRWSEIGEGLRREDSESFYDFVVHSGQPAHSCVEVRCGLSGFLLTMPEEASEDIWCPVGRQLVVDVDGSAYPCTVMMMHEFRLGSVFTDSVDKLFSSAPMQEVCGALAERRIRIKRCSNCVWRNLCQGGCMAMALEHKGTIWETDDFCDYRQKVYREAFDRILSLTDDGSLPDA